MRFVGAHSFVVGYGRFSYTSISDLGRSKLIIMYFRLFLEYARVMSEDRDTLNFELEDI